MLLAANVPQRNINRRDRKTGNTAATDIVQMPLHGIVEGFDVLSILTQQKRRQIVLYHRLDGMPALAAGISVTGSRGAIDKGYSCNDQLEMGVIAVFGINQNVGQRHRKAANLYRTNGGHNDEVQSLMGLSRWLWVMPVTLRRSLGVGQVRNWRGAGQGDARLCAVCLNLRDPLENCRAVGRVIEKDRLRRCFRGATT